MSSTTLTVIVFIIAIVPLAVLFLLVRYIGKKNAALLPAARLELQDFACPKCGRAMASGFGFAGRGIIFRAREKKPVSAFAHIGQALPNTVSMHLPPAENPAWHCAACSLVLVDHSVLVKK